MKKIFFCMICPLVFILLVQSGISAYAWSIGETGSNNAGWALDDSGKKFFAIGVWGIPGYTFVRQGDEPPDNNRIFLRETQYFNLYHIQINYQKPYMLRDEKIISAGLTNFYWNLTEEGYSGTIDLFNDNDPSNDTTLHYRWMKSINAKIDSLQPYIKSRIIERLTGSFAGYNYIHFFSDEPDTGRRGWFLQPGLLETYHTIAHSSPSNNLTYVDLGGSISGNRFFYEKTFGDSLMTGTNSSKGECDPDMTETYIYSFDGTPRYEYRQGWFFDGRWIRRPISDFVHKFYDNVKETARAYDRASDVLGVNSYAEFRDYPETAGETVDAIKAGCGNQKPVWLFFDGAAHQKPRSMSYEEYAKLVACQVYTSIVHGATGVYFYAFEESETATELYWPEIKKLAQQLQEHRSIFEKPVLRRYWDTNYHKPDYDHLHYSVRSSGSDGKRFLIATNTDKRENVTVRVDGFPEFTLEPLGIAVIEQITGD